MASKAPKAVFFDFMGTCLDWHTTISEALPKGLTQKERSFFALEWRQAYFDYNKARVKAGQEVQNFDVTQSIVLDQVLEKMWPAIDARHHIFTPAAKERLITAWHQQKAWPDVRPALEGLRNKLELELYVHANGSTRLQLDNAKSAELKFDMLFSSQLLGVYVPEREAFTRTLELLGLEADDVVMVAAHTDHLRGAKAVGMRTVYIRRWTDDIREDQDAIKKEYDAYLPNMDALVETIAAM